MLREEFLRLKDEGRALLLANKLEAAIEKYVQSLAFDEATNNELSVINLNIGICYQKQQQLSKEEEALKFIDNAIRLDASYAKAHYRKIQCLNSLRRFAESIVICKSMLKIHPTDADFISLFKDTNELIRVEQTNALSYSDYQEEFSKPITEERSLKELLSSIQSRIELKSDHTRVYLPGGFCDRFFAEALRVNSSNSSILTWLLANLSKVLEEQPAFCISETSASIIADIFKEQLSTIDIESLNTNPDDYSTVKSASSSTKNSANNSKINSNPIVLLLRLLSHCSIHITGSTIFSAIFSNKQSPVILDKLRPYLSAVLHANVKYFVESADNKQTAINEELVGFLQRWIDILTAELRDSWEREKEESKHMLRQLYCMQLALNKRYLDNVYFYRKMHLKKKDMVQVREVLIASYEGTAKKLIENAVHNSLFVAYLRKPTDVQIIDYILDIYSILLCDETFVKNVLADPAFQDFNIQIQRHLHGSGATQSASHVIKYGLLLFKTNKDKQLPELVSFLRIFTFKHIFSEILQLNDQKKISEALEFVGFMSCFDTFKVELIEKNSTWVEKLTLKVDFSVYEQGLNWLITVSNLCFDQLKDYEGKQKDKYGLDDERLSELKEFESKYRADDVQKAKEIFRYTDEFIKESKITFRLLENVGVIKHLSALVVSMGSRVSSLMLTYIGQMLSRLVTLTMQANNTPHKAMFDKQLLLLAAKTINATSGQIRGANDALNVQFASYISKMLKNVNPQIFQYTEVHTLIDALFRGLSASAHELLTFEILLSLVQLTSLGEISTAKLVNANTLTMLQNLLMEDSNYYIIHGALEVINNICLNEKMMERIGTMNTLVKLIFAHFDSCFGKLLDQDPRNIGNSYDEPIKIINTIYNIIAINASTEVFKSIAIEHLCANPDTLVLLLQKFAKNDGYMRMEFLYKFVFMTQSMRDSKKFTQVEKQMLAAIYAEIKEQYKQEQNGLIPKNDTRFEYMDYALA